VGRTPQYRPIYKGLACVVVDTTTTAARTIAERHVLDAGHSPADWLGADERPADRR
jgi:hypothetical protein